LVLFASPAGMRARRRGNVSFASPKESHQRKGEPKSSPLRCATGTLRCSVCAGSCSNSACGLKQSQALVRPALRYSPTPHGVGPGADSQTSSPAAPGRRARALGAMWRAAPPIPGVPLCMRRGAQRQVDQGPRLSEAVGRVRAGPHLARAPQVPVAPAEGADSGGAFLLVTFLLRKRKVTRPPGRTPGRGWQLTPDAILTTPNRT
jgi:hypothetical protein